ncbi:MAG: pirin family protein [Gammaproteobacteria bacterium]|nr:pirin family protein [Gammaproteobacteria bacterium]
MKNRELARLINGQNTSDGAGVKLKRIINPQDKLPFDPFILFDEFGSDEPMDYIKGFPEHPHRGFETVTYMLEGAMLHRDHLGNEGHLRKGDVQWMTAAHGILHSEMPEQEDGLLHGFQLWLNLPAKEKMKPPHYKDIAAYNIPVVDLGGGSYLKLIAGQYHDGTGVISGAVQGIATQPIFMDVHFHGAQHLRIPSSSQHTALVYVYKGEITVGTEDDVIQAGQLGQLVNGDNLFFETKELAASFLVLAALPLNEPVVQAGPFVMNTVEEIEQAFRDYRDGTLTLQQPVNDNNQ